MSKFLSSLLVTGAICSFTACMDTDEEEAPFVTCPVIEAPDSTDNAANEATARAAEVTQDLRISSINYKSGKSSIDLTLAYDDEGRLESIDAGTTGKWLFTYEGNTATTTSLMSRNGIGTLTFTFNDEGNVTQSTAANAYLMGKYADNATNTWSYGEDGQLESIVNGSKWYEHDLTNTYTDGKATQVTCGYKYYFTYTDATLTTPGGTLPATMLCHLLTFMQNSEDGVLGLLLNQATGNATPIPSALGMEYQADQQTGEIATEHMAMTANLKGDTLTLTTAKSRNNAVGFEGSTATVAYEKKPAPISSGITQVRV